MKVPQPQKTAIGYRIQLRLGGESIMVNDPDKRTCIHKAEQIKSTFLLTGKIDGDSGTKKTVYEIIESYIAAKDSLLSPSTVRGYQQILEHRFQSISNRKAADISDREWQDIVNKESLLCSKKTLKNAWGLLKAACSFHGIELPSYKSVNLTGVVPADKKFLDPDQIRAFVAVAKDNRYAVPLLLALSSLRISEIDGLYWDDIPEGADFIPVHGARVLDSDNHFVEKESNKNISSTRDVPILIPELKEAIERDRKEHGKVMQCCQSTLRDNCRAVCKEAGVPSICVHELRHSFASLCYYLRVPEKIVMEIGGWSDETTLRKIYTHISKKDISHYRTEIKKFYESAPDDK